MASSQQTVDWDLPLSKNDSRDRNFSTQTAIGCILIGAMIAFGAVGIWNTDYISVTDNGETIGITYTDVVVIVLAAAALLITVVGVGVAVLAIVGYQQLNSAVKSKAEDTVGKSLEPGGTLNQIVHQKLDKWLEEGGKKVIYRGVEDSSSEDWGYTEDWENAE